MPDWIGLGPAHLATQGRRLAPPASLPLPSFRKDGPSLSNAHFPTPIVFHRLPVPWAESGGKFIVLDWTTGAYPTIQAQRQFVSRTQDPCDVQRTCRLEREAVKGGKEDGKEEAGLDNEWISASVSNSGNIQLQAGIQRGNMPRGIVTAFEHTCGLLTGNVGKSREEAYHLN